MTAISNIPAKFLVPFAQNDSARVEIPVTTTSSTRASQSLGFPPLTMQPPETGGVPPNGEDFNGAMNQVARVAWWIMQGGGFPYDSAFATASQIGGYPAGAEIPRADGTGYWLNTTDNNVTNPEATDGSSAGWVPAWVYGNASISVTSSDVTVYPVTAAKPTLVLSGTLTANRNLILPTWTYKWEIVNNCAMGSFTLTAKTASGTGVALQNGAQLVRGDGTNIVQLAQSIAAATSANQAAQLAQIVGQLGPSQRLSAAVGSAATTSLTFADDQVIVGTALGGTRWALSSFSQTLNIGTTGAGGMDTGSAPASGFVAVYAGVNTSTGARTVFAQTVGASAPTTVYSGANAPAGYNATALISILPTNASGQFPAYVSQVSRAVAIPSATVLTGGSGSLASTYTIVGLSNGVPRGAIFASGTTQVTASAGGNSSSIATNAGGAGAQTNAPITSGQQTLAFRVPVTESQRLYYQATTNITNVNIFVSSYEF